MKASLSKLQRDLDGIEGLQSIGLVKMDNSRFELELTDGALYEVSRVRNTTMIAPPTTPKLPTKKLPAYKQLRYAVRVRDSKVSWKVFDNRKLALFDIQRLGGLYYAGEDTLTHRDEIELLTHLQMVKRGLLAK